MRRILGPAGVALGLLVTPVTATAACRRGDGPRYDAHIEHHGPRHVMRTALMVCDRRDGHARVLARAVYRYEPEHGTFLADAQAAGRRVAWVAGALREGRRTATVTVADARTGRRLSRRRVASWGDQHLRPDLSVALTTRGELAWIAPGPSDPRVSQVTLARPGLAPRVITEGPFLYPSASRATAHCAGGATRGSATATSGRPARAARAGRASSRPACSTGWS